MLKWVTEQVTPPEHQRKHDFKLTVPESVISTSHKIFLKTTLLEHLQEIVQVSPL